MRTLRLINVQCISLPKEQSLEEGPNIGIFPMFAQDVGRIVSTRDMCEDNKSSGNHFPDIMEGEHVVPLMKLTMWLVRTVYDGLIVPKNITLVTDRNT